MFYINPPTTSKSQWVSENTQFISLAEAKAFDKWDGPYFPGCYVDNGDFQAAGVAPDARELSRWFDPQDPRLKQFFLVKKEVLFALHPELRAHVGGDNDGQ